MLDRASPPRRRRKQARSRELLDAALAELGITGPKYGCGKALCGTYPRIRQAVKAAAANLRGA